MKKFTDGRTDAGGYNIIQPFFKRAYKKRKEKRKYVARPGIEPRTPDLRVRCPTDCATRPGRTNGEVVVLGVPILKHFRVTWSLRIILV